MTSYANGKTANVLPSQTQTRPQRSLSPRLTRQLVAYAAVAGVGLVSAASKARAEVVYTPIHSNLILDFFLDLNHDGINDFKFTSSYLSGFGDVEVFPQVAGNAIAATHESCDFYSGENTAAALKAGAIIGPGMPFQSKANC